MKRKAPGILPSSWWLRNNGYAGLETIMRRFPQAFAHITQDSKVGRRPTEWVPVAERIASTEGGLPGKAWMYANGHKTLHQVTLNRPELFAHIPRQETQINPNELVSCVRLLVTKYGNCLSHKILRAEGRIDLYQAMLRNPEAFNGIATLTKRVKPAERWSKVIDQLLDKNGELPSASWLRKNGLGALYQAVRADPKSFPHVKVKTKRAEGRNVSKWVTIADELVGIHGILPSCTWLHKHGLSGLYNCIRNNPTRFDHIPRNTRGKKRSCKEWIEVAKALINEHGRIPGSGWLIGHGYGFLRHAIQRHPDLFAELTK